MLKINNALLLVIDVQGKLAEIVEDAAEVRRNIVRLIEGVRILDVPLIATEQLPDKIGGTREDVLEALGDIPRLVKSTFSCYADPGIYEAIRKTGRDQVILCGIETHVCVYQTAMQLLADNFKVYLVADAVSSRTHTNKDIAITRMMHEGVKLASTEMVLFELQQKAEGDRFRALSRLVK